MKLPFTVEQFLEIFSRYNSAVYPMQIILYLIAFAAIYFSIKKIPGYAKLVSAILSFLWLWMGIVYNFIFFTTINKAAYLFGALFILQGILFFWHGVLKDELSFKITKNTSGIAAALLLLFSLVIYPIISFLLGHIYPAAPSFGLPCPTTIFTLAMLLTIDIKCSVFIYIIPIVWSIIGFTAAMALGMKEDFALLLSAMVTTAILLVKKKANKQLAFRQKSYHL